MCISLRWPFKVEDLLGPRIHIPGQEESLGQFPEHTAAFTSYLRSDFVITVCFVYIWRSFFAWAGDP